MKILCNTTISVFVLVFFAIAPAHGQWVRTNLPDCSVFASIGSNIFLVGTSVYLGGTSVYLTTDYGITWTNTDLPGNRSISALLANGSNLFAGGVSDVSLPTAVSLSTDSGKTWQLSSSGLPADYCTVLCFGEIGTVIFAGTDSSGIYRSTDSGKTWDQINNGLAANWTYYQCFSLVSLGTNLFASVYQINFLNNTYGMYRSTDSGATWIEIDSNAIEPGRLAVNGTDLFSVASQGVYRSTDSGASWSAANNGIGYPDGGGFAMNTCSTLFVGQGDFQGVFRSSDLGSNWTTINTGLPLFPSTTYNLGVNGSYLFAMAVGSDSGGVWRLPLDAVIMDEEPGYVAYPNTCTSDTFSFSLQTVGGCTNPTLDTTLIAGLDSNEYQLSRTHHAPEADTSWIMVSPDQAGNQYFTVTARYTNDSGTTADTSFELALHVAPPQSLSVYLNSAQLSDTSQGIVPIPVYATSASFVTTDSIAFRINLKTDLLTPESVTTPIAGAVASLGPQDTAGVWVILTMPTGFPFLYDTLLATVSCRAFVTDTNATAISVASTTGSAANCLSILGTGGETFTLTPQCGDPTLTHFLATGSPFIESIEPNPAGSTIVIKLSASSSAPIAYTISDALGRSYAVPQSGNTLDVSSLPTGVYFVSDGVSRVKFVKE